MRYRFEIFKNHRIVQTFFSQKGDGSMKLTNNPALSEKIFQNRKVYFLKNNIDLAKVVSAEIVHDNKVVVINEKNGEGVILNADGLITRSKDIYSSITSADCLPIFLFEPEKEIIGMIHAGWRSLEKNILTNAVSEIKKLGGLPKNILAGIGPAICQKHYEVGQEVAGKFEKYQEAIKRENNKLYLDLKKTTRLQLLELGILKKNIEITPECTFELPKKYFSARQNRKREIEAMIAVIGMIIDSN